MFELMDEWGPEKVVCVSDRRTGMQGVLVIDNTARGMGKGGTRMAPDLTVQEIARLARTMTWKWAALNLFFGGAKAGIRYDPDSASKPDALRAFARALSNEVPAEYVFGLDMGLTERDAAILLDEIGTRSAAVGTPEVLGGVAYDRLGVTGFGVAEAAEAAAEAVGFALRGARVVVQGFGAVGAHAARRLADLGATVVAVSSARGVLREPDGLDVDRLLRLRDEHGDDCVLAYGSSVGALGSELLLPCDVLIPAATQDVIDADVAGRISARLVVEGANMPTDAAAQEVLRDRGVVVVPDFIANGGGAVAAGFAMDARHSPFPVQPEPVFETVSRSIRANTAEVLRRTLASARTSHAVARELAQERVRQATNLRTGALV